MHHNFSQCSYDVKFKLCNSYCSSLYDCPLWNISDKSSNQFYVTWRKSIRKLFNLPYKTHCNLLPTIAGTQSIECKIITRNIKFICSALQSSNVSLQHLINISIECKIITRNIKFICSALQSCNVSLQHLINIPIQVTQYNRMNHFGFTRHLLLS